MGFGVAGWWWGGDGGEGEGVMVEGGTVCFVLFFVLFSGGKADGW